MSFESAERRESDSRAADPGALWRWIRAAARALIRIALCAVVLLPGNAAAERSPPTRASNQGASSFRS